MSLYLLGLRGIVENEPPARHRNYDLLVSLVVGFMSTGALGAWVAVALAKSGRGRGVKPAVWLTVSMFVASVLAVAIIVPITPQH
jgi:hypothetical protein